MALYTKQNPRIIYVTDPKKVFNAPTDIPTKYVYRPDKATQPWEEIENKANDDQESFLPDSESIGNNGLDEFLGDYEESLKKRLASGNYDLEAEETSPLPVKEDTTIPDKGHDEENIDSEDLLNENIDRLKKRLSGY